jgi:hypothetical protein
MGQTFGGASTDDLTGAVGSTYMLSGTGNMWAGWVYPTTLTAGRGLYGLANTGTNRVAVSATSGELDITIDRATTDGTYTTSGANLVVNEWRFIAVYINANNTPAAAVVVWMGSETARPAKVTVSGANGSGNISATATDLVTGNTLSGGSSAWQGEIENISWIRGRSTTGAGDIFVRSSATAIAAADEEFILSRFVQPLWEGKAPRSWSQIGGSGTDRQYWAYWGGRRGETFRQRFNGGANLTRITANNNTTFSESRGPRPYLGAHQMEPGYQLRRRR